MSRSVAAQMRGQVFEDGKTRVELTPQGLGDLEVEVLRDEFGKLRIVLRAENPSVLMAFRHDREALLGLLRESGLDIDERELSFEQFGGHGSRSDDDESLRPVYNEDFGRVPGETPLVLDAGEPLWSNTTGLDILT